MREYRVAWVIPTWNGTYLKEMLSTMPPGETRWVIENRRLGWPLAKCWNQGVMRFLTEGYDLVILANDDIRVHQDTGQLLAHGLLEAQFDRDTPILGDTHPVDDRELLLLTGYSCNPTGIKTWHNDFWPSIGPRFGIGAPDYSLFGVGRRYWDLIGPFDEEFDPAFYEDNDSHWRIRVAGYEAAGWAPYFHYGSSTIRSDSERRRRIEGESGAFGRCRKHYVRKWGVPPEFDAPHITPAGHELYTRPFDPTSALPAPGLWAAAEMVAL